MAMLLSVILVLGLLPITTVATTSTISYITATETTVFKITMKVEDDTNILSGSTTDGR